MLFVESTCFLAPGNIGDGVGLEKSRAIRVIAHFANKAIFAVCQLQQAMQQTVKSLAACILLNEL